MERDQAAKFVHDLLRLMVARQGSDLFLTADFPPAGADRAAEFESLELGAKQAKRGMWGLCPAVTCD